MSPNQNANTAASATENPSARARALNSALTPVSVPKTRASFYAQKNGGGYRTARATRKCEQFGCYKRIEPGEAYFDTREVTTFPKTKCICEGCAEESL